jgi:16S rRNA (uracil1498-N3)-methyltransferase
MRNRFFIDGELTPGAVVALQDDERHHARVLRVREGEEVEVFNGRGDSYLAKYESSDLIRLMQRTANREARTAIHLAMSIIQLDKFELVLQKATELGVRSIIPLITERTEVKPERYRGKEDRWRKIIFEAVKQSGRALIPTLEPATRFAEVVERPGAKIIFDPDAETTTTRPPENPTTVFIGPEGGWSEDELRMARDHRCIFQTLGPRRLRAETAAIAATAILSARSDHI